MSLGRFIALSFRLIKSEIRNHRTFVLFFSANLALGLLGFTLLDSFKRSVESVLLENSKAILGADLSMASRQPLSEQEVKSIQDLLPANAKWTQVTEMYSMVYANDRSRLVQIRAVEDLFPLYGTVELADGKTLNSSTPRNLNQAPEAWPYPELLEQLQVRINDKIFIGDQEFQITETVLRDPGANLAGSALAPRLYIGQNFLGSTNLVRKGSTAWYSLLIQVPQGTDPKTIAQKYRSLYPNSTLSLRTHQDEGMAAGRILIYLGDYLSLAALVALFLSAVGSAYLFHSFMAGKTREIAILQTLGLDSGRAIFIYSGFVLSLGFLSGLAALALTGVLLPGTESLIHSFFQLQVKLSLQLPTVLTTILLCTLASLLVCLPALMNVHRVRPSQLFQEAVLPSFRFQWSGILYGLPAMVLLWALAMLQTQSWRLGSIFTLLFLLAALLLFMISAAGLMLLARIRVAHLAWRLALRQLTRNRLSTLTAFLAIAIGTLVINIIPQLRSSLRGELLYPEKSRLPAFFLFDIQPEQLDPLKATLRSYATELSNISPLVRGQLTQVNQQPFQRHTDSLVQTRESETEDRFRARGLNLTYRPRLTTDEEIIEGRNFSAESVQTPEVSLEWRYAQRLGLKIGDQLTFDIQGVPITGKVVNFRRVRWTSFQPNFFIQFSPGILEDAPQTFLASVPQLDQNLRMQVQNQLVKDFPNVSLLDVSRIIDKLLEIVEQMVWALQLMATIAVVAGLLVLYSISRQQVAYRQREVNLLRVLGAEYKLIRAIFLREFFVTSFGATLLGASLSLLMSFALSQFLFEGLWIFSWQAPAASVIGIVGLSLIIAGAAIRQTLKQTAQSILQSS